MIELLQSIIGWAIVIGIIYGVWWLSEIPHRNQWGKTITEMRALKMKFVDAQGG